MMEKSIVDLFDRMYSGEEIDIISILGCSKDEYDNLLKQYLTIKENERLKEKGLTGYASIDRPWEKHYLQEEYKKKKVKRTVYQEILNSNFNHPNDLAIEFFGSKINFKRLFKNIDNTANALRANGVKKGDFVTICAAGIPETAYSFYALSKIGGIANMISPFFEKQDLIDRIEDCKSDILIIMDKFYPEMKETIQKSRIKKVIILPTLNSSILRFVSKGIKPNDELHEVTWNQFIKEGKGLDSVESIPYEPDLPLAMVYSSGSTGASKGILLSNDSFQNSIQAYSSVGMDVERGHKLYQIIPPWFSTGLSTSLHLPLSYGAAVFMDPRFERDIFVKNIVKSKSNYTIAPTSMYEGFLDESLVKGKDLSFFTYPFEGGEPLSTEVAESIEKVFREHGNDSKLRVAYGQCECGAAVSTQTQSMEHAEGSVGIPIPGVVIGIFDDEHNELKYNTRGNILVNTPCSMIGYYNNPEATNEYFYYDKNGTKWNCTGDIGYIDENGELYIEGRASDYTIINNKKVYNFDIENILMCLPEIKLCDVLPFNNGNISTYAIHLIFTKEFNEELEREPNLLEIELEKIQKLVVSKYGSEEVTPFIFKVRKEFPYAKSGKRDVRKIKEETGGFILFDGKIEYLNSFTPILTRK